MGLGKGIFQPKLILLIASFPSLRTIKLLQMMGNK
jgi:hypothetical protein